jgi:hypothetical protein
MVDLSAGGVCVAARAIDLGPCGPLGLGRLPIGQLGARPPRACLPRLGPDRRARVCNALPAGREPGRDRGSCSLGHRHSPTRAATSNVSFRLHLTVWHLLMRSRLRSSRSRAMLESRAMAAMKRHERHAGGLVHRAFIEPGPSEAPCRAAMPPGPSQRRTALPAGVGADHAPRDSVGSRRRDQGQDRERPRLRDATPDGRDLSWASHGVCLVGDGSVATTATRTPGVVAKRSLTRLATR